MKKHKLYKLLTQSFYNRVLKALNTTTLGDVYRVAKKSTCWDIFPILSKFENRGISTEFLESAVNASIFTLEYSWAFLSENFKRVVIYPASMRDIEIISKSSFKNIDITDAKGDVIIVAMPPESDLPSMMAGVITPENVRKVYSKIRNDSDVDPDWFKLKCNLFSIVILAPNGLDYLLYDIAEHDFRKYAEAKTVEEVYKLKVAADDLGGKLEITDDERLLQARCLKIALNFWLYRMASPDSFTKATPPNHARNEYGSNPTSSYSLSLTNRIAGTRSGEIQEVGIHMRNLRDERYYTSPEWKDKPRGSRWVEVQPYTRGGSGEVLSEEFSNDA